MAVLQTSLAIDDFNSFDGIGGRMSLNFDLKNHYASLMLKVGNGGCGGSEYHRGEMPFSTYVTGTHHLLTDGVNWNQITEVVFVNCFRLTFSPLPPCHLWKEGTMYNLYLKNGELYLTFLR